MSRATVVAILGLLLTACTGSGSTQSPVPISAVILVEDVEGPGLTAVLHVDGSSQLAVRAKYCPPGDECIKDGPPWVNGYLSVARGSTLSVDGDANVRKSRIGNGEFPEVIDIPSDPLELDEGPAVLDLPPDDYVIKLEVKTPSGLAIFFFGVRLI